MKKVLSLILAGALALSLAACGAKTPANADTTVLKVGASPSPHAEILEKAKELLEKDGITLEIIEFTDYVLPNTTLDSGDLDANFFQHVPYLDKFNRENKTEIVSVGAVHFEPLGIYPGKSSDLKNIKKGAVIAVPNDESNEARALLLLQDLGIIKLKEGAGLTATPIDIIENPYEIEVFEIEAAQLVNVLPDVDFAVVNGNYAVDGKILDTVLQTEAKDGTAAQTYGNILAVKSGNETDPAIQKLLAVLNSEEMKTFINERYEGLFIPVF